MSEHVCGEYCREWERTLDEMARAQRFRDSLFQAVWHEIVVADERVYGRWEDDGGANG